MGRVEKRLRGDPGSELRVVTEKEKGEKVRRH